MKWTKENEEFLINNVKQMTYTDIAKHFGTTRNAVSKKAKEIGIPQKFKPSSNEEINLMYKDYNNGMALSELSKKYNKSCGSLCNLFKRHHKKLRSTSEAMRKYKLNERYFENIDSEEKAYILGLLSSDGHVSNKNISFKLQEQDIDILEKIRDIFNHQIPIKNSFNKDRRYKALTINSQKIANCLHNYGISNRKTWNMQAPTMIPTKLLRHYYRGLFDGDGCLGIYNRKEKRVTPETMIILISGDKDFLEYVKTDINTKLNTKSGKIIQNKNSIGISYKIVWYSKQAKAVINWLYNDNSISLNRKQNIANQIIGGIKK